MRKRSLRGRRLVDVVVKVLAGASAGAGLLVLGWILYVVVARGMGAFSIAFFTRAPTPPGIPGGGVGNAIVGTLMITLLAIAAGVPVGMLAGMYLADFGRESRVAGTVRFAANVLMGVPSIIIGVFIYGLMVVPMKGFSGYAGAMALALIMLPLVARTTEDMLRLVPDAMRESALALGAPRWKVTLGIVFRAAKGGLLTGCLLAIARVSGETAPLLFTALNSPHWAKWLGHPTPNLTTTIFNYAMSPYADWQRMAWGASLLITGGVLVLTAVARFALKGRE